MESNNSQNFFTEATFDGEYEADEKSQDIVDQFKFHKHENKIAKCELPPGMLLPFFDETMTPDKHYKM